MLSLLCASAFAIDVTLSDPGSLDGEWAQDVVQGQSESARAFLAFVGHGMMEQAFTLQHAPLEGAAALPDADGFSLGVRFDTFPLRDPPVNGQGKVENTQYVPALPRITATWAQADRLRYGGGVSLTPPVNVGGASALVVGGDIGVAWPALSKLTVGLEADVTAGQAYAPVVATPEARAAGVLENVDEARYEAVCVPQAHGCIDSLLIRHGGLHLVVVSPLHAKVQPFFRVGGRMVADRFLIQVDLSDWRVTGLLPNFSLGANVSLAPWLRLAAGATFAPMPEEVVQAGETGILSRFSLGVAWAPGGARR